MSQITLQLLLQKNFPDWLSREGSVKRIEALEPKAQQALIRLLSAEISGEHAFEARDGFIDDLESFDISLNEITSEIISSRFEAEAAIGARSDGMWFFEKVPPLEELNRVAETLKRDGYCLSPLSLNAVQLTQLKASLKHQKFSTKGLHPNVLGGLDLLASEMSGHPPAVNDGDTYWLDDMDALVQDPLLVKLAFDPYIISVASRYLGCPPVHVQTNAWFSFPGGKSKNNLSMNGQLYHQDKEFVKFFKVFIYLSDVGEEQGPHSYIEGSHRDELHRKGVPLSDRVTDAHISKYYDQSRIKTVTGKAGSILFGDTSCVHKGESVTKGMRIMLQLEYASSLYLSPVLPFSDFQHRNMLCEQYNENFAGRITQNYNSEHRSCAQQYVNSGVMAAGFATRLKVIAAKFKHAILSK